MTQIDFYFNSGNKYRLAVRLGAKAIERSARMFILTSDESATRQMESLFWTLGQTSFLPNCRSSNPNACETPIIVDHDEALLLHDDILLNLRPTYPPFFSRFHRLIELVGVDQEDVITARERYKFYRDRGYEIRRHDMSGKS